MKTIVMVYCFVMLNGYGYVHGPTHNIAILCSLHGPVEPCTDLPQAVYTVLQSRVQTFPRLCTRLSRVHSIVLFKKSAKSALSKQVLESISMYGDVIVIILKYNVVVLTLASDKCYYTHTLIIILLNVSCEKIQILQ